SNYCAAYFTVNPDTSLAHGWIANNLSSSSNPLSYMWFWGDGDSTAGVAPSHTYASAGYFNICLRVSDGLGCEDWYCDSSTYIFKTEEVITVNVEDNTQTPTGIAETKSSHLISIYPNPSSGKFTLTSDISQSGVVEVYNITGTKVFLQKVSSLTKAGIDISQQAGGVYLVKVGNAENVWTQRVIVE
ncbi:MAG TPA: T9SS type A sorting domain-containing protein, partial [Chitinophagales bacterium]